MGENANTVPKPFRISSAVKIWLVIGIIMLFFQIFIGGVTRLTGSGLSITKWEIVTGTLPPLNEGQWNIEFDKYKVTPQYQQINAGMSLSEFKFIYFWEYFHRLWARSMGFVFLIPFLFFWRRKMIPGWLMRDLGIVVFLAAIVAAFGWIMVASGLVNRPWVSAYKLTLHLSLALVVYGYLFWTTLKAFFGRSIFFHNSRLKVWITSILMILALQIVLGGLMSGLRAGLFYPTFPDMHGEVVPSVIFDGSQWNVENIVEYEKSPFMPAIIQFLHRGTAYLLTIMVLYFVFLSYKYSIPPRFKRSLTLLVTLLVIQVGLGIFTLINCQGSIPVALGVAHQAFAVFLLSAVLYVHFQVKKSLN